MSKFISLIHNIPKLSSKISSQLFAISPSSRLKTKLRFNPLLYYNHRAKNDFMTPMTICADLSKGTSQGLISKQSQRFYEASSDWKNLSGNEYVTLLTANDIESCIQSSESLLIMFYAPWCHHCKSVKDEYAKAALLLYQQISKAKLAAIDCILHPSVYEKYNVVGYPTIKYYKNGRLIGEYHHRRKATDFLHFMLREPNDKAEL